MEVVAVIGLGYVGLPLAVAFGQLRPTIGFDLSSSKVDAYRLHNDPSGNVSSDKLRLPNPNLFLKWLCRNI
jgi:UDP-N-acetyl-D-galactosamine dehydrogenase